MSLLNYYMTLDGLFPYRFTTGTNWFGLTADADGILYAGEFDQKKVYRLNSHTGERLSEFTLPINPLFIKVIGSELHVTQYGQALPVTVYNKDTGAQVRTYGSLDLCYGMEVYNNRIYCSNIPLVAGTSSNIKVYNLDGTLFNTYTVASGWAHYSTSKDNILYFGQDSGVVKRFDMATHTFLTDFATLYGRGSKAIMPNGEFVLGHDIATVAGGNMLRYNNAGTSLADQNYPTPMRCTASAGDARYMLSLSGVIYQL